MKNLVVGAICGILLAALFNQTVLLILLLGLFIVYAALIIAEVIQAKETVVLNMQAPVEEEPEEPERHIGFNLLNLDDKGDTSVQSE